jgi:hypothetical protein
MVIPELNKLKHTVQTDESFEATCLPTLKEDLLASIDERWPEYETNHLYAISTMVDPRYKYCGFNNGSSAVVAYSLVLQEMIATNACRAQSPSDQGNSFPSTPCTSRSLGKLCYT